MAFSVNRNKSQLHSYNETIADDYTLTNSYDRSSNASLIEVDFTVMNAVVTSTTNTFQVEFNDLASYAKMSKGTWHKSRITFQLSTESDFINVNVAGESSWAVSYNGSVNTLQIDSVNAAAPSSNSDLYDKLKNLIS